MRTKISILFLTTAIFVCCKSKSKSTTASNNTTTTNSGSNPFDPAPSKSSLFVPNEKDEAVAKTKWPDADLAQLNSGYKIYTGNCGRCHGLPEPTQYDEAKWGKIVPWMGKKAQLNEADQKLILHYVLTKRQVILNPK